MTDKTDNRPPNELDPTPLSGDVGRLVRMAGPRPAMSEARVARMQSELRPLWDGEVERARSRWPKPRLLAAAALVAAVIGALFFTRAALDHDAIVVASVARTTGALSAWTEGGSATGATLAPGAGLTIGRSLATGEGARAALETTTGHSLRLDRDTRIVFLSEREVRLEQGAVYIDSGGEGRATDSLTVVTAIGRVEEIGTQFEVRLGADTLTVRVREGAIALGADGSQHYAAAGEELVVAGGSVRRSAFEPSSSLFDWTQTIVPNWPLKRLRLDTFLARVARESGFTLAYSDDSIAASAPNFKLHGDLSGLTPREALNVVLPAVDLDYRVEDGTLWIDPR